MLATTWQTTLPAGTPTPGSFPAVVPLVMAAAAPAGMTATATVPSQVAVADTSSLDQPIAFVAATLPAQPALVQSDAPSSSLASAAVTTASQPTAASIPAALATDVADSALPFIAGPTVSGVRDMWAAALGAAAARATESGVDLAASSSLWGGSVTVGQASAYLVPGHDSARRLVEDRATPVRVDLAKVRDAVLAEEFAAAGASQASWLSNPTGALEPLADAVDSVLTAYNDEPDDV